MHRLKVTVFDEQNNTLSNVLLNLSYNNQIYEENTDESGSFTFSLPQISNNDYDVATLSLSKLNYQNKTIESLQIFPDVNSSLNTILIRDSSMNETIIIEPHKLVEVDNA